MAAEFDFNLGAAKTKVLKATEEQVPAAFVHFFQGALFDRLLHNLILYFCALFQHEALARCMERSRQQHVEGYNPYLVAARLQELEDESSIQKVSLSQPYCEALMKHSSYTKPQQDRHFFEALYSSLLAVLSEAFSRVGKQAAIEVEMGRLFRSRHFNSAVRRHGPPRSVDSLTVTQIWSLKNETENRSLHAKLISGLYEKPQSLGVQVAAVSHSPLVCQVVSSPLVSRSLLADPLERDVLLALPFTRKKNGPGGPPGVPAAQKLNAAIRGVAAAQGVDLRAVASPGAVRQLQPTPGTLTAAGIVLTKEEGGGPREGAAAAAAAANSNSSPRGTTAAAAAAAAGAAPAPGGVPPSPAAAAAAAAVLPGGTGGGGGGGRSSTLKPFQSTVSALPEAAGLPYDEAYSYLCLLRRYILYGPTLGLATALMAAAGGTAAVQPSSAATAGSLSISSRQTTVSITGAALGLLSIN